jgi:serine/threonine-protein kinase
LALSPGESFGRYTIEALLGEGGMGQVYRAHDAKLHRRVALKILRLQPASDPARSEGEARLLREARAAARLHHVNAVAVFDVGDFEGTPYIVMELVEGRSLRAVVGEGGALDRRVSWLADVARALAAAHQQGLVHRDVKPENVMVRSDGVVKVLDFGIARHAEAAVDPTGKTEVSVDPMGETGAPAMALGTLTERGALVGTPLYMSPEQLRGEALDGRSDQFSWGVLAYELLAGNLPWRPQGPLAIMSQILSDEVRDLSQVAPEVPRAIADVVMRALKKRPDERYVSMQEIVDALGGKPARPKRLSMRPSLRRAAVVAMGVVLAGAGLWGAQHRRAGEPARPVIVTDLPPPPSSSKEASVAYKAAMQAIRDAVSPEPLLRRAVQLDPSLAAAHLRLSPLFAGMTNPGSARESYRRAVQFRANLDERDLILLDALEPLVARGRPDLAETERRLVALVDSRPFDVELLLQITEIHFLRGDFAKVRTTLDRVLAADPREAEGWRLRGAQWAYQGDLAASRAAFDECLRISPGATSCMSDAIHVYEAIGDCAAVEQMSQQMVTTFPDRPNGYASLARAFAARGRSLDLVAETLKQSWSRSPGGESSELEDRVRLAQLGGDFDGALQIAGELERALASVADEPRHADLARTWVEIYRELGRSADAARAAHDFLVRRDAWARAVFAEDFAFAKDVVPRMLAAELRAGLIDASAFDAQRAAWLSEWDRKLEGGYRGILWLHAYADIVETPSEAKEALALLPKYPQLTSYRPMTLADAHMGRTSFLAGRTAEAEPLLAKGAANCRVFDEPMEHTRTHWFLGQAREGLGDRAGACAAYHVVLDRWGRAKKSLTAERARARSRALGCPTP